MDREIIEKLLNYMLNRKHPEIDSGIFASSVWLDRFLLFFEEDHALWMKECGIPDEEEKVNS